MLNSVRRRPECWSAASIGDVAILYTSHRKPVIASFKTPLIDGPVLPNLKNRNLSNDDAVATLRYRHRLRSIKNHLRTALLRKDSKRPNNALWLPYNPL